MAGVKKPVTDPWIVIEPCGPAKSVYRGIVHATVRRFVGDAFVAFCISVWG
jgi:hypothetical protein